VSYPPRQENWVLRGRALLCLGLATSLLFATNDAAATPRPLPFTYPYETLPAGQLELEQIVDQVPVRITREGDAGSEAVTSVRSNLETEIEYGLGDRVEAAWYFVFRQGASTAPSLRFMGTKQRVRFRFADPGQLPLDLGLYLEVAEFHDEFEFEQKLILQRRFGPLGLHANLWVEQEYYFQSDRWYYVYNPTLGAAYQFSPSFFAGVEYWARGHFDSDSTTPVHHYAGPAVMVQSLEAFATLGAYLRWDGIDEGPVADDPFGKLWIRVMFGLDL
jgi:hypothetical protein